MAIVRSMLTGTLIASTIAVLAGAAGKHRRRANALRKAPRADEVVFARTKDRWRIALHHWKPRGEVRGEPILLCHGLASCAATWDLGEGTPFAPWFAARGRHVFAIDLRGAGLSDRPTVGGARGYEWGAHEYLTQDLPAAIARIQEECRVERVHYVGHSMGGVLLLAGAPELGRSLRTATIVGSTFDYRDGSDFSKFSGITGLLRLVRVIPMGSAARAYAPFAGSSPLDEFMFAPENLTATERGAIWASAFTWLPGQLLRELATGIQPGGFVGRDGRSWNEGLPSIDVPLLAFAGGRDRQCPVRAARNTFTAVGSRAKKFVEHPHLGHFDLVVGREAERLVYPEVDAWMSSQGVETLRPETHRARERVHA